MDAKAEHELTVFAEFALAARLVASAPPESRRPPEPDILVRLVDGPRYFELGRLADSRFAEYVLQAGREAPATTTPDPMRVGYPQRDVLRKKLSKSYETSDLPVELLLYYDNDAPHLSGPIPPHSFEFEARHVMLPLLRGSMGMFQKVWYFERYTKRILWSHP